MANRQYECTEDKHVEGCACDREGFSISFEIPITVPLADFILEANEITNTLTVTHSQSDSFHHKFYAETSYPNDFIELGKLIAIFEMAVDF